MPAEIAPSANERAFVHKALEEGVRIDGRGLEDFRHVDIQFGEEFGVVTVTLGKTKVMTRVSCEVTAPLPDRKFDGIFQIITELSPMASPAFESGRQNETETLLSRLLEKSIRRSNALDTESLCILAGQSCFSIRADVHVLSSDGGLVDAACLATVTALQHFRKPDVSVEGERVTVHPIWERTPVPLSLLHRPLCVTLAFVQIEAGEQGGLLPEQLCLVDASLLEAQVAVGEMVVTANKVGDVCQVAKLGGVPVDALGLLGYVELGVRKARELDGVMKAALDRDARGRDVGGLIAELSAENAR